MDYTNQSASMANCCIWKVSWNISRNVDFACIDDSERYMHV